MAKRKEEETKRPIELSERGFEILALLAFRYAIDRHCTQCMTRGAGNGDTIESIVLANLDNINTNFKCQMMYDIKHELDSFENLEAVEMCGPDKIIESNYEGRTYRHTYYTPDYLRPMFETLKKDYADTHNGVEWQEYMQN